MSNEVFRTVQPPWQNEWRPWIGKVSRTVTTNPEGRLGMSNVSPLSGILGPFFDSTVLSPLLFFCLHEDHLTIKKRRKLQWYGHVFRSSGLAKTIWQGTVKGGRRQGRQRRHIRAWTGLEFTKSQRAVENREKWRKLVAESSVVP